MSIYAKQIEETVEEIFEPLEDDQCEDCEVNFQATKMIMTEAICSAIQQAVAEERKKFRFLDVCHDYKTKEQFEMFISAREEDIDSIKLSIKDAKVKIKTLQK